MIEFCISARCVEKFSRLDAKMVSFAKMHHYRQNPLECVQNRLEYSKFANSIDWAPWFRRRNQFGRDKIGLEVREVANGYRR
jgi:hypothetical protein